MSEDAATDTDSWYRVEDMRLERVPVRLQWAGRMIKAWRGVEPRTRRRCWVVPDVAGELHYWPPKGNPLLAHGPESWQPLDPGKWPHPLPEPVRRSRPSFARIDHRRRDAAAPDAGSASAPPRRRDTSAGAREWWRDANAIVYQPPGHVSREMAEARVKRAILTHGMSVSKQPGATRDAWPQLLLDAARFIEAQDPTSDGRLRFEPCPRDISDELDALAWFAALDPPHRRHKAIRDEFVPEQRVLILRALDPPFSFAMCGRFLGARSAERARRLHDDAIESVWRLANRQGERR